MGLLDEKVSGQPQEFNQPQGFNLGMAAVALLVGVCVGYGLGVAVGVRAGMSRPGPTYLVQAGFSVDAGKGPKIWTCQRLVSEDEAKKIAEEVVRGTP